MRPFVALLTLTAAALALTSTAAAEPPRPAQVTDGGYAESPDFAVSVYMQESTFKDKVFKQGYATFFARRGDRYNEINRLRIPDGVLKDYKYTLESISLGNSRRRVIRFTAEPDSDDEADLLGLDQYIAYVEARAPYTTIWSGSVDALDPRSVVEIEDLDGDGTREIVLSNTDAGVLFCGQRKARLFPKVWDFKTEQFVDAPLPRKLLDGATSLTARLDEEAPRASHFDGVFSFRSASSDARDHSRKDRLSSPAALGDGRTNTPWLEGAEGWGAGQFVTANLSPADGLRGLRIVPGYAADARTYAQHGVPTRVLLSFDQGQRFLIDLPETPLETLQASGGLYVELPAPVFSRCMTLMLVDVKPARGRKLEAVGALSEVTPLVEMDFIDRQDAVLQVVSTIASESNARRREALVSLADTMATDLAPGVRAVIEAEMRAWTLSRAAREMSFKAAVAKARANQETPPNPTRRRLKRSAQVSRVIPLIGLMPTEQAREMLQLLLNFEGLTRGELGLIQRAIVFNGRDQVAALTDMATDPDTDTLVRARAIRIVARAGQPDEMVGLIPLIGQGDGYQRRAIVRALSRAPLSAADSLLRVADKLPDSPAAHDALWALDRIVRRQHRGQIKTLPGGERIMKVYNATEDLQIRLRALQLMRRIDIPNDDVFLITVLKSKERPELRSLAINALNRDMSAKVTDALIQALKDPAPDVRFKAADALIDRAADPSVVAAATAYARQERWERGLIRAYRVLAAADRPEAAEHLYEVIRGADAERALNAMTAISDAKNPVAVRTDQLIALVITAEKPIPLRQEAIQALAWVEGPDSAAMLQQLLIEEAWPVRLRVAAARVMGRRTSKLFEEHLLNTLVMTDEPKLQRVCARVLAKYPSRESLKALRKLRPDVDPRTQRAIDESLKTIRKALQ